MRRFKESGGNRRPFGRKLSARRLTAGSPIPITGIVEVAFNAMKVSVDPGAVCAALVRDEFVRLVPVVLAQPPQRDERRRQSGRRSFLTQRMLEGGKSHRQSLHLLAPPALGNKPTGRLFDHLAERKQRRLLERPPDKLQAQRQAVGVETAGDRD